MASITYDGQSFLIDGRRVWIVGGAIHYARVPREQWGARIQAAKHAGLNTIETPVIWSRHEPRQGQFDFSGDNDVRYFVQLVHQAGMFCILRPGPFVGGAYDLGGLPPWLLSINNLQLRTANAPFLEACSRYITAVAQQVRDLQVTSPGAGGPILLIQNEAGWTCGDDGLAHSYLGELNRYLREAGLTVPTINANDLWQGVEGEIDCWTGFDNLLANLRQLASVRPDQPRLVIDFRVGEHGVWGDTERGPRPPAMIVRKLAEVLAAGGQFNLNPFHGGTNFGFSAGRESTAVDSFYTASADQGAPLDDLGHPSASFGPVRRLCTFASRFARVFANLEPSGHGVVQHPGSVQLTTAGRAASPVVVHAPGSAGSVAFIFNPDADAQVAGASSKSRANGGGGSGGPGHSVMLLLPDGTTLPVELGNEPVTWCLFNARVTGRTQLDYTNLSAFAVLGRVLVLYGPAGSKGILSINGSRLEVDVPRDGEPTVVEHEGVVVVVTNAAQVDQTALSDEAVFFGVRGVDSAGNPISAAASKGYLRISATGESRVQRAGAEKSHKSSNSKKKASAAPVTVTPPAPPKLGHWDMAGTADYVAGQSPRYASITGPADLDSLGAAYGYGWYKLRLKGGPAGRHHLMFPKAAHRLHAWLDGEFVGVAGMGPGATADIAVSLKSKPQTLVVLAENFGRFTGGSNLAQKTGVYGHGHLVTPLKLAPPKLVTADPVDALAFRSPLWQVQRGEATDPVRPTWTFQHRKKGSVLLRLAPVPVCGILLLNGEPVQFFDQSGIWASELDELRLSRGMNTIQLALLGPSGFSEAHSAELTKALTLLESKGAITESAEWAFAKWEAPGMSAYGRGGKKEGPIKPGIPAWWRAEVWAGEGHGPLVLDATGLSKGQFYVNGRHIGRYFVSSDNGKPVGPQTRYIIPRQWLRSGEPSELTIFDEHGNSPAKCRLTVAE
ncbi:MAG: beta-galactosidase [Phycisphaerales bacterium]|nr:beta-galactosidase [Phycisphaerales bacterium]